MLYMKILPYAKVQEKMEKMNNIASWHVVCQHIFNIIYVGQDDKILKMCYIANDK